MEKEDIKETLALIRTQSTIRFAALPFFLTALAVLANASHNGGYSDMKDTVALVGAGLSLIAIVIEIVISRNLIVWWKAIQTKDEDSKWEIVYAHRNNGALKSARTALIVPYLAALYYWIFQLWNLWGFPVCGRIKIAPDSWPFPFPTKASWAVLEGGIASFLLISLIFCFALRIWARAEPEMTSEQTAEPEKTSQKPVSFWTKVSCWAKAVVSFWAKVPFWLKAILFLMALLLFFVAVVYLYRTVTAGLECSCYSTVTAEIKCYVFTTKF